jgi:hypothetical protein
MHGYWTAASWADFGPIDAPAGPVLYVKFSQTPGAGTASGNKQLHQLGARIAGN